MKRILPLILLLSFISLSAQVPTEAVLEAGSSVTNYGYILYPSPDADYANIIEVGPGKTYQEIHDIPTNLIVKNTLIKIFPRTEPYRTKVFVDVIGSETEKVRFQGFPDTNGNLPIITFENATTWGNTTNSVLESGSAFVVYGTYGNKPAWIDIVNLHIKDAPYASIWAKGDHIAVKGCILENSANGVFFQAANQLLIEISTHILIEGNRFTGNGTVSGWLHHNIYSQGMYTTIQFNNIEHLRDGAFGASLKDRSSHTVIRYNKIGTSARTLDLVEPEDTDQVLTTDANWDDTYVYGNLLINKDLPVTGAGVNMVHYGYDNVPTYRKEGTLYFFNNTVIVERTDSPWRVNIFDVNSTNATVEFANNIVTATGMQVFYIFRSNNTDNAGNINFDTSYFSIQNTQNNWQLTENSGSYFMTGDTNIMEGNSPGFVDYTNEDFTLNNNSPSVGAGVDLTNSIGLSVNFNCVTPGINLARSDQSNPSLGCFSSNATASTNDYQENALISKGYPNPFNKQITIEYAVDKTSSCTIEVYNSLGQKVKTLFKDTISSGKHSVVWDGKNEKGNPMSRGVYYYKIQTENQHITKAIIYN